MSTVNAGWRGPNIVKEGLVLYLDAASGTSYSPYTSGNTWRDISGNNYSGSLFNGPIYNSANGGTIVFDGVDDYATTNLITVGTNNTTNIIWYKWNGVNQAKLLSYIGASGTSGMGFYINNGLNTGTAGNKISILYGGSFFNAIDTGTLFGTLVSNVYTQLIVTRDTTTTRLYQDGIFLGSTTRTPNGNSSNLAFSLGEFLCAPGEVSITMVYNRALSTEEVLQNYNSVKSRFGL
jgi:hypothetical protein